MKSFKSLVALVILGLSGGGFVTGCASKPQVDWTSRMGNYTFDQAVVELGPPTRQASLADGSTVAEWVTGHAPRSSFSFGVGSFGSHSAVGVGQTMGGGYTERVLRLTFDKNGVLENWSKNY